MCILQSAPAREDSELWSNEEWRVGQWTRTLVNYVDICVAVCRCGIYIQYAPKGVCVCMLTTIHQGGIRECHRGAWESKRGVVLIGVCWWGVISESWLLRVYCDFICNSNNSWAGAVWHVGICSRHMLCSLYVLDKNHYL